MVVGGLAAIDSVAQAQFGGTQDMMLEKLRRQQSQVTRNGIDPSQSTPSNGNQQSPQVNNNYYIEVPGYRPYGYYNGYQPVNPYNNGNYGYGNPYPYNNGYGNGYGYNNSGVYGSYYGNPYQSAPIVYPPIVNGVPLNQGFNNGGNAFPQSPIATFGRSNAPVAGNQPAGMPAPVPPHENVPPPADEDEIARRVAGFKPSTDAGRIRADQLIAEGDREFAAQQYRHSASKYREAITKAADYAPAHLRTGHAYIATGDYELAVNYFGMGFALSRTIERPGFTLADLYRGDAMAKEQHSEALADAVLRQPTDGGLLFLTGIFQHYDGHPLQARDYFRRAAAIPGRHQQYAEMFLPKPAAADLEVK